MVKIKKYANRIEHFLHSEKGQRFFNFAYSIGAAIVIWGALFKILHLPFGSALLCIGMGTEIAMFVLTAFDRPPKEYSWEDVFPVLESGNPEDRPDFSAGSVVVNGKEASDDLELAGIPTPGVVYAPTVLADPAASVEKAADMADATNSYLQQMQGIAQQMGRLNETTEALNNVTQTLLSSYQAITENSETISENSKGYVDQMEDLNRNIAGLNTIYEIQLKSISSQLESIDRVNRGLKDIRDMYDKAAAESSRYCEETEKMARYMKQLNSVYEKMITAMTINMVNPMMNGHAPSPIQEMPSTPENPFEQSINNQNQT